MVGGDAGDSTTLPRQQDNVSLPVRYLASRIGSPGVHSTSNAAVLGSWWKNGRTANFWLGPWGPCSFRAQVQ